MPRSSGIVMVAGVGGRGVAFNTMYAADASPTTSYVLLGPLLSIFLDSWMTDWLADWMTGSLVWGLVGWRFKCSTARPFVRSFGSSVQFWGSAKNNWIFRTCFFLIPHLHVPPPPFNQFRTCGHVLISYLSKGSIKVRYSECYLELESFAVVK